MVQGPVDVEEDMDALAVQLGSLSEETAYA